jgi:hypothetical protein
LARSGEGLTFDDAGNLYFSPYNPKEDVCGYANGRDFGAIATRLHEVCESEGG